ncbi:intraflagellar transport protein 27 homolog [Hetaerina americana]|uniref:intraflagellar transport protein 27 homolog n=1 Tax=Hetaerina americana TaxID=62018 RepID=UPI003A7F2AB5
MHEIALFKIAVVGESLVGKTSIIQALLSGGTKFSKNYVMTSDVAVNVKDIIIPESKDVVELLLYDSAGNILYEDFLPKFWNGLNAAFVVFDVTSKESYNSIRKWVDMVKTVQEPATDEASDCSIPGVVFANKTDLVDRRIISSDEGNFVASHLGFGYFEGTAKNSISVDEAFTYLAKEMHNKTNFVV